ncbi:MAG: VWA domain-containing protein [Bacteroidetes bacterium]|nr:VWA domain-containing protein [Bacteroidota bacterium]
MTAAIIKTFFRKRMAVLVLIFLAFSLNTFSQTKQKTRILFIFDCSKSMTAMWDKEDRMTTAKKVLIHLVDSLKKVPNVEIALRCYGYQYSVPEHNCTDSRLVVPFKKNNATEITDFITKVEPNGYTPIAYSLKECAKDFPDVKANNVVILITDGIEECGGNPCDASAELQAKQITLKPYVVGIGLPEEKMKNFDCVGNYFYAKDKKKLNELLTKVVSHAMENTTVQVNLLDAKDQPTITNVEMDFEDASTAKNAYHFMHTLNKKNLPDTLPAIVKTARQLKKNQHNIIKIDAAQGQLKITSGSDKYHDMKAIIRQAGKAEIVNVQPLYTAVNYLVGEYDIEILTLPRIIKKNVKIGADQKVEIDIPKPCELAITYKEDLIADIYIVRDGKQEWVTDATGKFNEPASKFLLQPGSYKLVYRPAKSKNITDSKQRDFNAISGTQQLIQF